MKDSSGDDGGLGEVSIGLVAVVISWCSPSHPVSGFQNLTDTTQHQEHGLVFQCLDEDAWLVVPIKYG